MAVTTRTIIENFDIVKDIGASHFTRFIYPHSDPFFFQAAEEGLGDRVVPTVSTTAHAELEIMSFAKTFEVIAAELRSLIGMHNHLLGWFATPYCH